MKKSVSRIFLATVVAVSGALQVTHGGLVRHPTAMGAAFDVGQIVEGNVVGGQSTSGAKVDDQYLTRTGVYVTESGTYNERFSIYLTVGGLFWYALPQGGSFVTRLLRFGPGVGQAQGQYLFGDVKNPAASLQFGLFPMKYNPDAKNLGEYLFRSGAYPTYIQTGGWSYLDAASYMAQGARLNVPVLGGKISNDFTVFMERDLEPTGDLDLGYLFTAKPLSFLELGGGALWTHAVPFKDEKDIRSTAWAYNKNTGLPLSLDTAVTQDTAYYTFHSVKLMARASVDIGALLNVGAIAPGDFKLYGEWAWLGVKNYDYYFEKPMERMPMMGGINLPTFKLLDRLSFEVEYHKSRFQNSIEKVIDGPSPIPVVAGPSGSTLDSAEFTRDDLHWSVYARRKVYPGVSLVGQVASDHFRPFDINALPSYTPAMDLTRQWYYILRLEIGI